ncbi:MAG: PilN domain-containing protein [Deltaproteobacteria bacterium]|nr:PilN domain-containing protein [Deltaproteobacteria bacterium]
MIRINLLPFRAARKRENVKRHITIYFAAVCAALALIVISFFWLSTKLSGLKDDENRLKQELASYQKELQEIKDLESKIKEINSKLSIIKDLEKGKTGPVHLLSDISNAVPKDKLWLTSLKEAKGTLLLSGTAMDNETVSLFMKNLKNTEQVTADPVLKSTTRKELPQFRLTVSDFDLECKIFTPVKEEAPKKPDPKKK